MTNQSANPLAAMVSFPGAFIIRQQDIVPSSGWGWGLNLTLSMPRTIAFEYIRSQLEIAEFRDDTARFERTMSSRASHFRFILEGTLVRGTISDFEEGSQLFLSTRPRPEEPIDEV